MTHSPSLSAPGQEAASPHDPASLLTASDVAAHCRVSLRSVRRWIAADLLLAIRLGRSVRIRPQDLQAFLSQHGAVDDE